MEVKRRNARETWLLYSFVKEVRTGKPTDDDELYYHCLDELEKVGLYDSTTGELREFSEGIEPKLTWVEEVLTFFKENLDDLSDCFLSNSIGETSEEHVMIGQQYEDFAFILYAIDRFLAEDLKLGD